MLARPDVDVSYDRLMKSAVGPKRSSLGGEDLPALKLLPVEANALVVKTPEGGEVVPIESIAPRVHESALADPIDPSSATPLTFIVTLGPLCGRRG